MKKPNTTTQLYDSYLEGTESNDAYTTIKNTFEHPSAMPQELKEQELHAIHQRIHQRLAPHIDAGRSKRQRFFYLRYAAALLLFAGLVVAYQQWALQQKDPLLLNEQHLSTILPPASTITLTLENGHTLPLDSLVGGAKENITLTKDAEGFMNLSSTRSTGMQTLFVPHGKQLALRLPDGSKVWLNANTTLMFPAQFDSSHRQVRLHGEGYFEIFKKQKHPFVVLTDEQRVEVLGTHFNISDYGDSRPAKTTLAEGSIAIRSDKNQLILTPNQQAIRQQDGSLAIKQVDAQAFTAWKDGFFVFNQATPAEIIRQLSLWYGLTPNDIPHSPTTERFTGKIAVSTKLVDILKILKSMGILLQVHQDANNQLTLSEK